MAIARGEIARVETLEGDRQAEDRLSRSLRPRIWLTPESRRERLAARTEFVDRETVDAMATGVSQTVIVGAGYDCRALRLRKSGTRFFEVDHPVTQADKRRRLAALEIPSGDIAYLPIDLASESLGEGLERAGHGRDEPSLFICEGLLLYLCPAAIRQLLGSISTRAAPGSRLVLTARAKGDGARGRSLLSRIAFAAAGEPARSSFEPDELLDLLAEYGFAATREFVWPAGGARRRTLLVSARSLEAATATQEPKWHSDHLV